MVEVTMTLTLREYHLLTRMVREARDVSSEYVLGLPMDDDTRKDMLCAYADTVALLKKLEANY